MLSQRFTTAPVIVQPADYDVWLKSENVAKALNVLVPLDPKLMYYRPISLELNDAKNDNPESAAEIDIDIPSQEKLF